MTPAGTITIRRAPAPRRWPVASAVIGRGLTRPSRFERNRSRRLIGQQRRPGAASERSQGRDPLQRRFVARRAARPSLSRLPPLPMPVQPLCNHSEAHRRQPAETCQYKSELYNKGLVNKQLPESPGNRCDLTLPAALRHEGRGALVRLSRPGKRRCPAGPRSAIRSSHYDLRRTFARRPNRSRPCARLLRVEGAHPGDPKRLCNRAPTPSTWTYGCRCRVAAATLGALRLAISWFSYGPQVSPFR